MSNNIKVSVIIPVYNAKDSLSYCLDSIIYQSYDNLEIICIDDGSSDGSDEILKYYKNKDERIILLQQANKGPSFARNSGLDVATGDYISFVDADDILDVNAYKELVDVAKDDIDIVMFGGNTFGGYTPDWITHILNAEEKKYTSTNVDYVLFHERVARPFLWLHFIKRELLETPTKIRFDVDLSLGEDQLFQFKYIPRAKTVTVLESKLYNYRVDQSDSLMQLYNNRKSTKFSIHVELVNRVISYFKNEKLFDKWEADIGSWIIRFLYDSILDFPAKYKHQYAQQILALYNNNNFKPVLLGDNYWRYKELLAFASNEDEINDESPEELRKRIEFNKYQIEETLKSKAFKLGRFLTPANKRIDLKYVTDVIDQSRNFYYE